MDENKNGLGEFHRKYYYTEMYVDLARLEEFSAMVFNSLYDIMRDTYASFIREYNKNQSVSCTLTCLQLTNW